MLETLQPGFKEHNFMNDNSQSKDLKRWLKYLGNLTWQQGHLDESSFKAALRAASLGIDSDYVYDALCALITKAGDGVKSEKIRSQINRAYTYVEASRAESAQTGAIFEMPTCAPKIPRWRVKTQSAPAALHGVAAQVPFSDIYEFIMRKSPRTPDCVRSCDYLDALYRCGEMINIFTKQNSASQLLWERDFTLPAELPTGSPEGVLFGVNPVNGELHPNPLQNGKLSERSEQSVTAFRFAVLESAAAPAEAWLKLLVQLPLAIESITQSGERGIHALLRVDARTQVEWDWILEPAKPYLIRLGADPGALSTVRLSRLPQAFCGARQQRLIYLNPNASATSILNLPDRPVQVDWLEWAELVHRAKLATRPEDLKACLENLDAPLPSLRVIMAMHFLRLRGGVG